MRSHLSWLAEVLSVLLFGLMAGFFFAFAVDVAPAMTRLDAGGYIVTQQWINRAVRNALFGSVYFGSALAPWLAAAAALACRTRRRAAVWLLIALMYGGSVFGVTRAINVPINEALARWDPASPPADWVQARDRWNESNGWRAVGAALCFAASVLVVARRAADDGRSDLRPPHDAGGPRMTGHDPSSHARR